MGCGAVEATGLVFCFVLLATRVDFKPFFLLRMFNFAASVTVSCDLSDIEPRASLVETLE